MLSRLQIPFLLLLALLTLGHRPARAMDANALYLSVGMGLDSCAEAMPRGTLTPYHVSWLGGAITAANMFLPHTYSITATVEVAERWITDYCRVNPHQSLDKAFRALVIAALPTRHLNAAPPQLPPPPAETPSPPITVRGKKRS